MSWNFIVKRVALFLIVVWAAASVNFFVPRLGTGRDPIREKLGQLAASGGLRQDGIEAMVKAYQTKFGLDKPLYIQYFNFLGDTFTLDLGYSLANYPARVGQMIGNAIPWTIGLMVVSVLIGFMLGTLMGALSAWPSAPRFMRSMAVPASNYSSSRCRAATRRACWLSPVSISISMYCTTPCYRRWPSCCSRSVSGRWACAG